MKHTIGGLWIGSVGFEQMVPIGFNQELMNAYDQP